MRFTKLDCQTLHCKVQEQENLMKKKSLNLKEETAYASLNRIKNRKRKENQSTTSFSIKRTKELDTIETVKT